MVFKTISILITQNVMRRLKSLKHGTGKVDGPKNKALYNLPGKQVTKHIKQFTNVTENRSV